MKIYMRFADNPDKIRCYRNVRVILKENHLVSIVFHDFMGDMAITFDDCISCEVN